MSRSKPLPPLTPVRYRPSLFSIDISSIGIKDTHQQLEYPFFSLSKKPDTETRAYTDTHGNTLTIKCTNDGLPTIWDKDLLIFAISQIMERRNRGEEVSPTVRFHLADVIEFGQMTKSSTTYRRLDNAIRRLAGCMLETNIRTGNTATTKIFHIIDEATIKRKYDQPTGRLEYCEFTLSDWLWRAIEARQVLTLHPDYFRLRQPLARRIYEIVRKHCGRQAQWAIFLPLLYNKSGSQSKLYEFRRRIRQLTAHGDLLDYAVAYDAERDIVIFRRLEGSLVERIAPAGGPDGIELPDSVADEARRRHGSGLDLAAAERDWRRWLVRKGVRPTNPAALFLSFLATWADRESGRAASPPGKADWMQETAIEWWGSLGDAEREAWRDRLDDRVELSDGEGWFRPEEAIAREAFDLRWRHQPCPAAETELPQQLLARAAAAAGVGSAEIERSWREWIPARPYLHGRRLVSVMLHARELAKRRPEPRSEKGVNR